MQKTLLTYGDSNTFGTMPMATMTSSGRFPKGVRWPTVTQSALGSEWDVIACGLPGRTATALPDPVMGMHMNGQLGLQIALASHAPIDVLAILLGANDCQSRFGLSAEGIASAIAALLGIAKAPDIQDSHSGFDILLICPPKIQERGTFVEELWRAEKKSAALPALLKDLAAHNNVAFMDANDHITTCAEDGVHFDANAHQTLGAAVAHRITTL